jgi:hypothetical protein
MGEHIIVMLEVVNLFGFGFHVAEILKEGHELAGSRDKVLAHGVENFKEVRISFDEFHLS